MDSHAQIPEVIETNLAQSLYFCAITVTVPHNDCDLETLQSECEMRSEGA